MIVVVVVAGENYHYLALIRQWISSECKQQQIASLYAVAIIIKIFYCIDSVSVRDN